MMIERFASLFSTSSPNRINILYGPGVDDIYINMEGYELRFEEALYEVLKAQGFERIIFFSMHRSVYFYDEHSAELSRPSRPEQGRIRGGQRRSLQPGPLPGLQVYRPPLQSEPATAVETGGLMGDLHALRLLDTLLHQTEGPRTAIVFPQAETTLRYFEDPRSLAGLLGEWTLLSPANPHAAFFIFSADNYTALAQIAEAMPVPELRSLVLRKSALPQPTANLHCLGGPEAGEMLRLFTFLQQSGAWVDERSAGLLAQRMALTGEPLRQWLARLSGARRLDLVAARRHRWIQSLGESDPWQQLERLVGLEPVKQRLREQAAWVQLHRNESENHPPTLHMLFTGNPGTGKTTVARLLGEIYFQMGILKRGHLLEVRGSDLIAEHVGGTAVKTNTLVDRALDGVLFIDEAYTLVERERGGFGQEALDTLLTRLEEARQRLVVVAAGYPEPMRRFRQANPGLARRFPEENVLVFPDLNPVELWQVLQAMLSERGIAVSKPAESALQSLI